MPAGHEEPLPYDRARLALLFDQLAKKTLASGGEGKARRIDAVVKQETFRRLALGRDDSLLDLGTGFGRVPIELAGKCRFIYGVDISRVSLAAAREEAVRRGLKNLLFAHGAIEEPSVEIDVAAAGVNRMLLLWSLHHLPDDLKAESLATLAALLRRPGRIVVGDIIFFDNPRRHRPIWDKVGYDGGVMDRPATAEFLADVMRRLGGEVEIARLHPLAGVVAGIFPRDKGAR